MFGNTGKIIRIDLESGRTKIESLPEAYYRDFIGGSGPVVGNMPDFQGVGIGVDIPRPRNKGFRKPSLLLTIIQ